MSTNAINQLPFKGCEFLTRLKHNNSKDWFNANRELYESDILNPTREFVISMGAKLRQLAPAIIADPRVNRSLFRINRDIRFSKDKSPYKTHISIFFWEGKAPKLENSGYYFHIKPEELYLGAGLHIFPKWVLEKFRKAVSNSQWNNSLTEAIVEVRNNGCEIGGDKYKRYPPGYNQEVAEPELLLYKGIYGLTRVTDFNLLSNVDLVDFCFEKFRELSPIHNWLIKLVQ